MGPYYAIVEINFNFKISIFWKSWHKTGQFGSLKKTATYAILLTLEKLLKNPCWPTKSFCTVHELLIMTPYIAEGKIFLGRVPQGSCVDLSCLIFFVWHIIISKHLASCADDKYTVNWRIKSRIYIEVHLIDKHFEQSYKTARVRTLMSLYFSLASFITVRKCEFFTQVLKYEKMEMKMS